MSLKRKSNPLHWFYRYKDYFSYKDDSGLIADWFDCSIVNPKRIYGLRNILDDSVDIVMMFDDSKNPKDTSFTVTEITDYRFHYPYMGLIKGGKEIFTYDFTKSLYGYCRLSCPVAAVSITENVKSSISFRMLLDVGPYFVFSVLETKDLFDMTMTYSKRFIEKSFLLPDKILTFYNPIPWLWDDTKSEDPGLIIHTVNYMQQINLVKYNSKVVLQARFKVEDIRHLNGTGLLIGKRGSKIITHLPIPIKIDDKKMGTNVYLSPDTIKSIDYNFEEMQPYIYVWDSEEYLKKFEMVRRDSTNLTLVDEFFVYPGFTGKETYRINDNMIFVKTLGVKLHLKDQHLK